MKNIGLTKTQKVAVLRIFGALQTRGHILSYTPDAVKIQDFHPAWSDDGFAKALDALTNLRQLGLRHSDRGWLMLLLCEKDKAAVDAKIVQPFLDSLS